MENSFDPWTHDPGQQGGSWDPLPTWNRDPLVAFQGKRGLRELHGTHIFGAAVIGVAAVVLGVIAGVLYLAHCAATALTWWSHLLPLGP